jgi:hypothetical protein
MTIRRFGSTLLTLTAICVCLAGLPGVLFAQNIRKFNTPEDNCKADYEWKKRIVDQHYKNMRDSIKQSQTDEATKQANLKKEHDQHEKDLRYVYNEWLHCTRQIPGFKNRNFQQGSSFIKGTSLRTLRKADGPVYKVGGNRPARRVN